MRFIPQRDIVSRVLVREPSCIAADRAIASPIVSERNDSGVNRRGMEKSEDREREKERPIVRSMREEIGDSISTQMSRGQIFPGSCPWGLGCLWDTASGDSLPNKTRETGRKREKVR